MFLPRTQDAIHKLWLYRVLTRIADDSFLTSVLYFKGGTCAAMRGLLDRFSVDLDFDFVGSTDGVAKTKKRLEDICADLGLEIKDGSKNGIQYFLKYQNTESDRNTLKIDTFFPPLLGNKYEPVRFVDIDRILHCQTIETMFANKLIALIDRFKKGNAVAARDVYDVHHFFLNGYGYDTAVLEQYGGDRKEFFKELYNFVGEHVTQKIIDQDLNFLLTPQQFRSMRTTLKQETLVLLQDEINRLS